MTLEVSSTKFRLHKPIVLVGMMGCGKSAIGRALATGLDIPFMDSDAAIVDAAQASIAEIFERDGEAFFREREAEVIARLLSDEPCILSTGGGAFLADRNRKTIASKGLSVWLDAPLSLLWERVKHKDTRPLLKTANPYRTLSDLFDERTPIYEKAVLRIPVRSGATIDETTQQVIDNLLAQPNILEVS